MGVLTSILMPLLRTGATVGLAAIPGAGPVLAPIGAGLMSAGSSLASGQGPLTSLSQGAIQGGLSYGFGELGDWMNGADAGQADVSQFQPQYSFASDLPQDPLTDWAVRDLNQTLQQRLLTKNSFMIGGF